MYEVVVGIEVHCELKSNSKVFSDSMNEYSKDPNTNVNVIDLGYPGVLPRINKKVIDMAMSAALAFNCSINRVMHFDRKNYFYPDLTKGYQITEQETPIGHDGYIEINDNGIMKKIGLELIDIVSKPEIRSSSEAVLYLEKLREILLYLGISDVKIEEGSMRCDCNVSIHKPGTPFGTKVEVKNIGSIANVGKAIEYETKRQSAIIDNGGTLHEETRRLDDKTMETILMRTKETGNDYRYFPEPYIPYIVIDDEWLNNVKAKMPVFADELKIKYHKLGINENNIKTIISRLDLCQFLESVIDKCNPITAANLLTGDVLSYLNKNYLSINSIKLDSTNFIETVNEIENNTISSKQAKEVIPYLIENGGTANEAITKLGLVQITDTSALSDIVDKVIKNNPESVKDYKDGKDRAIKYLMGQIMKETKGQANPQLVNNLLMDIIKNY